MYTKETLNRECQMLWKNQYKKIFDQLNEIVRES